MLFSLQKVFCPICGIERSTKLGSTSIFEVLCGKACRDEYRWRETLSIMGKEYKPQSKKAE